MAESVSFTTAELFAKIGALMLECEARARREDELRAEIVRLSAPKITKTKAADG